MIYMIINIIKNEYKDINDYNNIEIKKKKKKNYLKIKKKKKKKNAISLKFKNFINNFINR